jgi:hypothetical protein
MVPAEVQPRQRGEVPQRRWQGQHERGTHQAASLGHAVVCEVGGARSGGPQLPDEPRRDGRTAAGHQPQGSQGVPLLRLSQSTFSSFSHRLGSAAVVVTFNQGLTTVFFVFLCSISCINKNGLGLFCGSRGVEE